MIAKMYDVAAVGSPDVASVSAIAMLDVFPFLDVAVLAHGMRTQMDASMRLLPHSAVSDLQEIGIEISEIDSAVPVTDVRVLNQNISDQTFQVRPIWAVKRTEMTRFLLEAALLRGADVETDWKYHRFLTLGSGQAKAFGSRDRSAAASLLIGCDGSDSSIRKMSPSRHACRFASDFYLISAVFDSDLEDEQIVLFFNKYAKSGFVWAYPHGDGQATVQIKISAKEMIEDYSEPENAMAQQAALLAMHKVVSIGDFRHFRAEKKTSADMTNLAGKNLFLIGQSAHMASPLTGETFSYAVNAAKILAETSIEAVRKKEGLEASLREASRNIRKARRRDFRWHYLLQIAASQGSAARRAAKAISESPRLSSKINRKMSEDPKLADK